VLTTYPSSSVYCVVSRVMLAVVLCDGTTKLTYGIMLPVTRTAAASMKNYLISIDSACVHLCVNIHTRVLLFRLSIAVWFLLIRRVLTAIPFSQAVTSMFLTWVSCCGKIKHPEDSSVQDLGLPWRWGIIVHLSGLWHHVLR